jgi:UDP-N-acetylglucosamine transferase subunit ALG13
MIFLTVGSMLPFDRLVKSVDIAAGKGEINDTIFAQIGSTEFLPKYIDYVETLNRIEYMEVFKSSKAVISHAGIGTISIALKYRKPLLVVPRLKKYNEIVNNHQLNTANRFLNEGYILKSDDTNMISERINELSKFIPKKRTDNSYRVEKKINDYLKKILDKTDLLYK